MLWLVSFFIPSLALASESGGISPLFRMLGSLGIVLGLLLLLYALMRKGVRFLPHAREGAIRILETRPLGGKKFLFLVEVRGKEYLLGVGGERIDFLARTDEPGEKIFDEELRKKLEVNS